MPTITVDQQTFDRLAIAASLSQSSVADLVRSLVDERIAKTPSAEAAIGPTATEDGKSDGLIDVFKVYKRNRVEGTFDPQTMTLRIRTAPWGGREFSSPTAAAIAVVEQFAPDRHEPNTNGRRFWKIRATGRNLDSVIGRR
jgi:hypothetical protein